jgi:GDP-L-fucose synthase
MNNHDKIYIAGHRGMVGSALVRRLRAEGFTNLLLAGRKDVDLTRQAAVEDFFVQERPDYVFLVAGKVGGIYANDTYPAEFIAQNLQIGLNVIDAAYSSGVKKLLFLGSSCIYPKFAPQPMPESCLLTGALEPTNEWYAIAKIAGIKLCQAYRKQYGFDAIAAMPTNLYGPEDNFSLQNSHVFPALLRKCHEAKVQNESAVSVWGSGAPMREFLHVDDLADACLFLMQNYSNAQFVNIGAGKDISIRDLTALIAEVVGFKGDLRFDASKPDGTPKKLLDVSYLQQLGWQAKTGLREGIAQTYQWYLEHLHSLRRE